MTEERIIAYLLEELPEEELEQFEDECFAQESWPPQLSLVEEDLVDTYLRNELTPERRQRFERNYLTTEARQERVLIAAALLRQVDRNKVAPVTVVAAEPTWGARLHAFWNNQTWALRAAAALALAAIMAGAWFYISRSRSPETFATLTLAISASNRSEGAQAGKVRLSPDVDALKISLTLPERLTQAARYRVTLENERGETKPVEIVGQDAQSVSVVIPAAELARGQYALKLFVVKDDGTAERVNGSYFFTVE